MTQDEIMEMARQAGFYADEDGAINDGIETAADFSQELEAFAKLVAAKEREACEKVCEDGVQNATDWDSSYWDQACKYCASAIKARGQA